MIDEQFQKIMKGPQNRKEAQGSHGGARAEGILPCMRGEPASVGRGSAPKRRVTGATIADQEMATQNQSHDGIELDPEYRVKTMEQLYFLWDRPVHLETVINGDKVLFSYDGSRHTPALKN